MVAHRDFADLALYELSYPIETLTLRCASPVVCLRRCNMKNKVLIGLLVIIFFALTVVLIHPSPTICEDDVRGYETTANSSLEVARSALSKISSSASTTIGTKVAAQLDGL